MSIQFYDSSAFAKLFLNESGSNALLRMYSQAERRLVSRVAFVEVEAAIRRREREQDISPADADFASSQLNSETQHVEIVELTRSVVADAQRLLKTYRLRSLDAIQLASAKQYGNVDFVVSDVRLIEAARAQNFAVIDPANV